MKKRYVFFFKLLNFEHQTLYGTVLQHDNSRPHAARHISQFFANNNVQISPLAFLVDFERVGGTWSRQSERSCSAARGRERPNKRKQESKAKVETNKESRTEERKSERKKKENALSSAVRTLLSNGPTTQCNIQPFAISRYDMKYALITVPTIS